MLFIYSDKRKILSKLDFFRLMHKEMEREKLIQSKK